MFEKRGWKPEEAELYWEEWPALTQADLQEHRDALVADNAPKSKLWLDSSGGSTGFVKTFYHSPEYRAGHTPEQYWAESVAGWKPGARRAKLWGSGKDVTRVQSWKNRLRFWLRDERLYNSFEMNDARARAIHDDLSRFRPDILVCYAGSLYEFARFLEQQGLSPNYPKTSIITSAEPLTSSMREVIERVFPARVFDRYGSREVGVVATECHMHEGLHFAASHNYVEVVSSGTIRPVWDVEGDILVTTLSEKHAPLIRYQIGDSAIATRDSCGCGRNTDRLIKICGRVTAHLLACDGRKIYGEYFTHLFYNIPQIARFQVRQRSSTRVEVKVVERETLPPERLVKIQADIAEILGACVTVEIDRVTEIPLLPSGKHQYVISDIN